MRTREQYVQGLSRLKRNLYYQGDKVGRDHEALQESIGVLSHTFDAAADPATANLCTAVSHLNGQTINRFCHVHQDTTDLHKKQDMTRTLCRHVGYCIGRCMGIDAINAVNAVSFEADKVAPGRTQYHQNFRTWLERFQTEDLVGSCAQTDTKGERLKRPGQQADADAYLRVVEKNKDGIVVRGCKVHITQAAVAMKSWFCPPGP